VIWEFDVWIHTNFTALKALFHPSHPQDFKDDLDVRGMLQAPLGVGSDLLELVGSNAMASKIADDVKQQLNADCASVSD